MNKSKVIREFGRIFRESDFPGERDNFSQIFLDDITFDSLKNFVAENQSESVEVDSAFSVHRRKSKDYILVKNYVGVVETRNGTLIEILPKIFLKESQEDIIEVRRIFLRMLRCLRNSPFKSIDEAHLKTTKFPLLEIFIKTYLDELELLVKRGISQFYVTRNENQNYLRGHLDLPKHLSNNIIHKQNFFVEYDEFNCNIPQNKIIKSTLDYLSLHSHSPKNLKNIYDFIDIFYEVERSQNLTLDFQKVFTQSRLYNHYQKVLGWSRIFLLGESFTNFKGNSLNKAILFPMESIFEDYVSTGFKRLLKKHEVFTQHKQHFLIEDHIGSKKFRLIPDIVSIDDDSIYVMDTKWKIIDQSGSSKNYGISQGDLYQLFAYGQKYMTDGRDTNLVLIYPKQEKFASTLPTFSYNIQLPLRVIPFDLNLNLEDACLQVFSSIVPEMV
ncbi:McrC family protein [Bacteroidota bacterium]